MSSEWAAVDDLIRELGSVRNAADSLRTSATCRAVVERAIADAAEAINQTIDHPNRLQSLTAARNALGIAEEVLIALDSEIARSLRIRSRAAHLREQAGELVSNARAVTDRADRPRPSHPARPRE